MAEIVNLHRMKKARERAAKEAVAAEKRAKSGTPKALRELKKARSAKAERELEAKRLDAPSDKDR
jgi:hypothetical protein